MCRQNCILFVGISLLLTALPAASQSGQWWMDEPVRLVQTNLREVDTSLDPKRLVQQLVDFPANALLFGMGGIVAHYPTQVPFHYASPHLPPGRDTFGEVVREAHARGIRVIGRFDLSKTQKAVFDSHPEWFFRRANGEPVVYNGLYSTCINAGYYRGHAMKILADALERYDVDGLFFNMFGNPASDYSGNPIGLCQCESCRSRFQARYGHPLPSKPTPEYRDFIASSAREVAGDIAALIHKMRPKAAFITYIDEHVDGIMSESNTAVDRPLPLWPYSASENVSRARNSQPSKMAFNACIDFVDIPYRFSIVPPAEVQLRLYQNMAHGAGPSFTALGTLDQEDMTGIDAARPVFRWHAGHEDLYIGQESAARILLLGGARRGGSHRGLFRILSEQHIPFALSDNPASVRNRDYDLVIATGAVTSEVDAYVRQGGRLLVAGTQEPPAPFGKPVRRWTNTRSSYFRIRDHSLLPSLKNTQLLFLDGGYVEMPPVAKPLLTLIPPSMFGPPEKVHIDRVDTDKPGLLMAEHGKGKVAYIPWDIDGLYYRHSSPGHAGLIADLVDYLMPSGRQLRTNAHPLVEITVMRQPKRGRTIVHFVNVSGHSSTGYFSPLPMRNVLVELHGSFQRARSARLGTILPTSAAGEYTKFTLPQLESYDAIVLE